MHKCSVIVEKYKGNKFLLKNSDGSSVVTTLKGIQALINSGVLVLGASMQDGKLRGVRVASNINTDYIFNIFNTVLGDSVYPCGILGTLLHLVDGSNMVVYTRLGDVVKPICYCVGKNKWKMADDNVFDLATRVYYSTEDACSILIYALHGLGDLPINIYTVGGYGVE